MIYKNQIETTIKKHVDGKNRFDLFHKFQFIYSYTIRHLQYPNATRININKKSRLDFSPSKLTWQFSKRTKLEDVFPVEHEDLPGKVAELRQWSWSTCSTNFPGQSRDSKKSARQDFGIVNSICWFSLRRSDWNHYVFFMFQSVSAPFVVTQKRSFHHVSSLLPFATTKWSSLWISEFHLPWQLGECKSMQLPLQSWPQCVWTMADESSNESHQPLSTPQTSWWAVFENLTTAAVFTFRTRFRTSEGSSPFFGGEKSHARLTPKRISWRVSQSPHQAPPTTSEFRSNYSSSWVLKLVMICGAPTLLGETYPNSKIQFRQTFTIDLKSA